MGEGRNGARLTKKLVRTYALAWAVLVLGLCLTAVFAWGLFAKVRVLDENRFERQVKQTAEALRDRLDKYEGALTGLADFAGSRTELSRAEWNFRVRLLQPEKNYPGLFELGLLEHGGGAGLPESRSGLEQLVTFGEEPSTLRILHAWVRPPSAFDGLSPRFLTEAVVTQSALAAIRLGAPVYCYRRELGTEIAGKPARGFTIFVPLAPSMGKTAARQSGLEQNGFGTGNVAVPGEAREGILFGSIEPKLLLESLFGTAPRELGFDLFSAQPLSTKTWLNGNGSAPPTLSPGFKPYLQEKVPLQFHGQEWLLAFYTTPLFDKESPRYRPWTAIFVGTALSVLIAALLFVQIHARVTHEKIAAELRLACEELQQAHNERDRLSRDLHDGAIQSLYGLGLTLGHYERLLVRQPQAARQVFEQCRSTIDGLIAELRRFLVQQTPDEKSPRVRADPAVVLAALVQRFQSATAVPVQLSIQERGSVTVSPTQEIHLRQIAQEALSNSLRHGSPSRIRLSLEWTEQRLRMRIEDDGKGFEISQVRLAGQGLANMQTRAIQCGGTLHVQSEPGHGTQITLEIPMEDDYDADRKQALKSPAAHRG